MKSLFLNLLILTFTLSGAKADEATLKRRQEIINIIKEIKADLSAYVEGLNFNILPQDARYLRFYKDDILDSIAMAPYKFDQEVDPKSPVTCHNYVTDKSYRTSGASNFLSYTRFLSALPSELEICLSVQRITDASIAFSTKYVKDHLQATALLMHFQHFGYDGNNLNAHKLIFDDMRNRAGQGNSNPNSNAWTKDLSFAATMIFMGIEDQFNFKLSDAEMVKLKNLNFFHADEPADLLGFAEKMDQYFVEQCPRILSRKETLKKLVRILNTEDAIVGDLAEVVEGLYRWDLAKVD